MFTLRTAPTPAVASALSECTRSSAPTPSLPRLTSACGQRTPTKWPRVSVSNMACPRSRPRPTSGVFAGTAGPEAKQRALGHLGGDRDVLIRRASSLAVEATPRQLYMCAYAGVYPRYRFARSLLYSSDVYIYIYIYMHVDHWADVNWPVPVHAEPLVTPCRRIRGLAPCRYAASTHCNSRAYMWEWHAYIVRHDELAVSAIAAGLRFHCKPRLSGGLHRV